MKLTFLDLNLKNRLRCEDNDSFAHMIDVWRPSQWSNAMAGECGETCNLTKKMDRIIDQTRGSKPVDQDWDALVAKAKREIGDVVIYADLLSQRLGTTLEECVRTAFNEKSYEIGSQIKL